MHYNWDQFNSETTETYKLMSVAKYRATGKQFCLFVRFFFLYTHTFVRLLIFLMTNLFIEGLRCFAASSVFL